MDTAKNSTGVTPRRSESTPPRVLSIAGTDPTGGAGIQADLKSIAAAGGFGMNVVTSLVAQNTHGVRAIHTPPLDFLEEQLAAVFDDVDVDAVKIGMLGTAEITQVVLKWLEKTRPPLVVLDPVMVATSGDRLLEDDAIEAMRSLLAVVDVVTPNVPELAILCNTETAETIEDAIEQSLELAKEHNVNVIAKGGHTTDADAGNAVVKPSGNVSFVSSPRVNTKNTHGTGCSLSSALATRLAGGEDLDDALAWTTRWLRESIAHADKLHVGTGNGPIDHFHRSRRMERTARRDATALPAILENKPPHPELKPRIPAAGPYTQQLWEMASGFIDEAVRCSFIGGLNDGSIDESDFLFYMEQDAWYMENSFRTLSMLSAKAPTQQSQVMWSEAAQYCLVRENDLHLKWLNLPPKDILNVINPTPITAGIGNFHTAQAYAKPYVVGATAAIAGIWMYTELALHVQAEVTQRTPYLDWAEIYGDEEHVETTELALRLVEEALAEASEKDKQDAHRVFKHACLHELRFLQQPYRRQ